MDDLSNQLNQILSDPQSMRQIQELLGSLQQSPPNQQSSSSSAPPTYESVGNPQSGNSQGNSSQGGGQMPDLSMLSSLLGGLGGGNAQGGNPQDNNSQGNGQMPDLSMLSNLLGGLGSGNAQGSNPQDNNSQGNGQMPDLSMLSNLLGGLGGGAQNSPPAMNPASLLGALGGNNQSAGGIPTAQLISMIAKVAPLLRTFQQEDDSTRLLRALRPLLSPKKRAKIDEALRLMRMMRMLPLVRGTGLLNGIL